jgi:hypothetical protein
VQGYAPDGSIDESVCLVRRKIPIIVNPGAMLSDVRNLYEVSVQPCGFSGKTESQLVHQWGTGGDDNPVNPKIFYILLDEILTRIGTHEFVVACYDDIRCFRNEIADLRDINCCGNVYTAMADVYTDFNVTVL